MSVYDFVPVPGSLLTDDIERSTRVETKGRMRTVTAETGRSAGSHALAAALAQFDAAADHIALDRGLRAVLRVPQRELTVHFPVKRDDGSVEVFQGYRVQHNVARGPAKGGLRFHPRPDLDDIRALAMWMTWKAALVDAPRSGAQKAASPAIRVRWAPRNSRH